MSDYAKLDQLMETFTDDLHRIPEELRTEPGACGEWSVKDLVGHLAYWEGYWAERLETLARGETPPAEPEGEWWLPINDAEAEKRRDASYEDVLIELTTNRHRIVTVLESLPDNVGGDEAQETYKHMREHLTELREWKQRKGLDLAEFKHDA
jgi:uncharacterized damage-inducible protein DinB